MVKKTKSSTTKTPTKQTKKELIEEIEEVVSKQKPVEVPIMYIICFV